MTQKSAKKKSKKSSKAGADASVMGSLRPTRPTRLGGDRRAATTRSRARTVAAPKTSTTNAGATRTRAVKPRAATRSPAAAAQRKATAAQRPVAPPPPPPRTDGRPSGTEIVTTAVQAAGELAQIGMTVGSQLLKRAARRIPRP
jgi:hypothetical protein